MYSFLGSATVDAETAKAGDIVYTVSSSDPESDVISYSATCTPLADCPLEIRQSNYSKTCLKRPLKKKTKIGFPDRLPPNAGQRYCRMLQGEHSAVLSTCIKLPFVIKISVLSIFEWPLKTGFTVQ